MAEPVLVGSWTGDNPGTLNAFNYTLEWETLKISVDSVATAIVDLKTELLAGGVGALAAFEPGTLAHSASIAAKVQAETLLLMTEMQASQEKMAGAIAALAHTVNNLSSTVASGVATQQLQLAETINKNEFDVQATQAALKRNNLPEVTVSDTGLLDRITKSINQGTTIAAQTSAAGFVTGTASKAITTATTYVADSAPAQAISNWFTSIFSSKSLDAESTTVRTTAKTNATTLRAQLGG